MTEKLKLLSTEVFFEEPYHLPTGQQIMQMPVLLPLDAISYVEPKERGNPHGGYTAYFKKSIFAGERFRIKSINPVHLTKEQVETLNPSR